MRPNQYDLIKQPQAVADISKHIRDLTDRLREDLQEIPDTAGKLKYFDFFIKTHIPRTLHELAADLLMSRGATRWNDEDILAAVAEIEAEGIIVYVKRLKAEGKDPGNMVIDAILGEYDRVVFTKEIDAGPIQVNRERILWTEERIAELERCRVKGLFSYKSIKAVVEDGETIDAKDVHDIIGLLTAWELQEGNTQNRRNKIVADNFTHKGKKLISTTVGSYQKKRVSYHNQFRKMYL